MEIDKTYVDALVTSAVYEQTDKAIARLRGEFKTELDSYARLRKYAIYLAGVLNLIFVVLIGWWVHDALPGMVKQALENKFKEDPALYATIVKTAGGVKAEDVLSSAKDQLLAQFVKKSEGYIIKPTKEKGFMLGVVNSTHFDGDMAKLCKDDDAIRWEFVDKIER